MMESKISDNNDTENLATVSAVNESISSSTYRRKQLKDETTSIECAYSWLIVLQGFIGAVMADGIFSFGIFLPLYSDLYDSPQFITSIIGSVAIFLALILSPLAGYLIDNYGPKKVLLVAVIFSGFGYFLASLSTNIWQLFLTQGVLVGIGASFGYIGPMTAVGQWFDKNSSLAMGVAGSGTGFGQIFMVEIITYLLKTMDIKGALQYLALIQVVSLLFCTLVICEGPGKHAICIPPDAVDSENVILTDSNEKMIMPMEDKHLSKEEEHMPMEDRQASVNGIKASVDGRQTSGRLTIVDGRLTIVDGRLTTVNGRHTIVDARLSSVNGRLSNVNLRLSTINTLPMIKKETSFYHESKDLFKSRIFVFIFTSLSIFAFGATVPLFYIPAYTLDKNLGDTDAANQLISFLGVGSGFGRIIAGILGDRFSKSRILMLSMLIIGVLTFLWIGITSYGELVAYSVLYGLGYGFAECLTGPIGTF